MIHWPSFIGEKKKKKVQYTTFWIINSFIVVLTFPLSLMDPLPRTMILQPVYCSSSLAVIPRGPSIRPTKLNCESKATVHFLFPVMCACVCVCAHMCMLFFHLFFFIWLTKSVANTYWRKNIYIKVHLVELKSNTNGQTITLVNS